MLNAVGLSRSGAPLLDDIVGMADPAQHDNGIWSFWPSGNDYRVDGPHVFETPQEESGPLRPARWLAGEESAPGVDPVGNRLG